MFHLDDALAALSNERRRKMMYLVTEADEEVFSYEEIAQGLTEEGYIEELNKQRFEAQIVHKHLPKMEETGLLEHDSRSETVRHRENERIEDLLEDLKKYED